MYPVLGANSQQFCSIDFSLSWKLLSFQEREKWVLKFHKLLVLRKKLKKKSDWRKRRMLSCLMFTWEKSRLLEYIVCVVYGPCLKVNRRSKCVGDCDWVCLSGCTSMYVDTDVLLILFACSLWKLLILVVILLNSLPFSSFCIIFSVHLSIMSVETQCSIQCRELLPHFCYAACSYTNLVSFYQVT